MLGTRRWWLQVPGAVLVGLVPWFVVVEELDGSPTSTQWAGVVVMMGCLAVEGLAARELVRRWRPAVDPSTSRSRRPGRVDVTV